jgi:hypothetical protein
LNFGTRRERAGFSRPSNRKEQCKEVKGQGQIMFSRLRMGSFLLRVTPRISLSALRPFSAAPSSKNLNELKIGPVSDSGIRSWARDEAWTFPCIDSGSDRVLIFYLSLNQCMGKVFLHF